MRSKNDKIIRLFLPVAIGAGGMCAFASAVNAVTEMNQSPSVGDIVSYADAPANPPEATDTRLTAHRRGQPDCALAIGTLLASGGSFVVENEIAETPNRFAVHWAGARTADGVDDCGTDADLLMFARDLNEVAIGAGGYGAGKKWLPIALQEIEK